MRRLVDSWICAEKEWHGNSLAAAIKGLNDTNTSKVTHSRVSEWRRGVYAPSQLSVSYMLFRALPWVLKQAGAEATDEVLAKVESSIWRVERKGGFRYAELAW